MPLDETSSSSSRTWFYSNVLCAKPYCTLRHSRFGFHHSRNPTRRASVGARMGRAGGCEHRRARAQLSRGAEELLEWAPKSYWSGLQRAIGVGSKELLEWAPKSYWSGLQRAIGVGSKELRTRLKGTSGFSSVVGTLLKLRQRRNKLPYLEHGVLPLTKFCVCGTLGTSTGS